MILFRGPSFCHYCSCCLFHRSFRQQYVACLERIAEGLLLQLVVLRKEAKPFAEESAGALVLPLQKQVAALWKRTVECSNCAKLLSDAAAAAAAGHHSSAAAQHKMMCHAIMSRMQAAELLQKKN